MTEAGSDEYSTTGSREAVMVEGSCGRLHSTACNGVLAALAGQASRLPVNQ
jgi:hypothetical protein